MKSVCKAFVIVVNEECVQSFCYCGNEELCAKLLLLWRMKSVCKAFVIVENEECVQSFCYCGVVANEECVQSFCYCGE